MSSSPENGRRSYRWLKSATAGYSAFWDCSCGVRFWSGVAYIVLFEGLLASLDTVARRLTVMYYFRVLVLRWLEPASGKEWSIDLATAPECERAC